MSQILIEPEIQNDSTGTSNGRWMVLIYNNETNSMDEVVTVLICATGCTVDEAYIEMWEAHTYGKASVHFGPHEECATVAEIISTIGVRTEVTKEWDD